MRALNGSDEFVFDLRDVARLAALGMRGLPVDDPLHPLRTKRHPPALRRGTFLLLLRLHFHIAHRRKLQQRPTADFDLSA